MIIANANRLRGKSAKLPLISLSHITDNYVGAFKMPHGQYGSGAITINPSNGNLFGDGAWGDDYPVYEVSVPTLVNESSDLSLLNTATQVQAPTSLYSKVPAMELAEYGPGDPNQGYIHSLYHDGTNLYVSVIIEYDAGGIGTDTTLRVNSPSDLVNTTVTGAFKMSSKQFGSKNLIQIPGEHQAALGGDIMCTSGNLQPIVTRQSRGPSLWSLAINDLATATTGATINQTRHMAWENEFIEPDYLNYEGACGRVNNDLWTVSSSIGIGFIIPGTRTVCYIGGSGGHNPGALSSTQAPIDGYSVEEPGIPCTNQFVGTRSESGLNQGQLNGTSVYKDTGASWVDNVGNEFNGYFAVSYTHLTLPTIYSV